MFFLSCGGSKNAVHNFDEITVNHKRIAVLPIQTKINLSKKQSKEISAADLKKTEIEQSKDVQNSVESFLVNKKLRVRIQSQSMTNSKLRSNGIKLETINEEDVTKLCRILGVDAVVSGQLESTQPMSEELARGLDAGKNIASRLGGGIGRSLAASVKTTTNEGWCSLSLFEAEHGDRLWTFKDDLEMGAGSRVQDIIHKLMKKGTNDFPYRK